jgi:hypothetical protein
MFLVWHYIYTLVDGRIILKFILMEYGGRLWIGFVFLKILEGADLSEIR